MLSATYIVTAAAVVAGLATQVAGHMSMWSVPLSLSLCLSFLHAEASTDTS